MFSVVGVCTSFYISSEVPHTPTFGATQGINTALFLPQAFEEFSLSRYKRIGDIIEFTEEKAQEMVDTLRKMYPDNFTGHRILHPSTVLRQRKQRASPGLLFQGAHFPGSKRILRQVKDTSQGCLADAQVQMALGLFAKNVIDPTLAMSVAKEYREPAEKILNFVKPVRHFVSPIAPLMLQLSLYSVYETNLKRTYPSAFSMAGMPWYAQQIKEQLMSLPPSRQKVKLDQSAFDARLRPADARVRAKLLASNLANATTHDRKLYEEWVYADLCREQVGAIQGIRSAFLHIAK